MSRVGIGDLKTETGRMHVVIRSRLCSTCTPQLRYQQLRKLDVTLPFSLAAMGSIYAFELPTTGSLSFSDHVTNGLDAYATQISSATQARANLRAVLKESKHTDGDKDYLRLVKVRHIIHLLSQGRISHILRKTLEEYLPYLYAIINCIESGDLLLTQEPGTLPLH